ncbi:DUF1576 domain-containing protein [Clostridium cochlearium]|uniref:DUF1576 domain-containing protein n=1 Tax=Clostridium cochlearium TaxID=1494 RepID=UPI000BBB8360|nr:DUF1576 domain-containing protein [Clostridium cochlearium]MBE6064804.1 DUF1576 domain-containing protein [Clostridium cochlearium]MBU5269536.1 DUF1576 domain-containing protein [Clostridium cochlearium]
MSRKLIHNYRILIFYFSSFVLFGLLMDSPKNIFLGLYHIIVQPDLLITDYFEIAGIGAPFVNSGLLTLIFIAILIKLKLKPTGAISAALFTIAGFSFFGKNLLNVWPIFFGTWLYSKHQKEPFFNYILMALFGTTLSPAVSYISFSGYFILWQGILLGILSGILLGFVLPSIAAYCIKLHDGFNLYNAGFAGGLLGTLYMSILRSFGINFPQRTLWSTKYTHTILIFLCFIFVSMIVLGYFLNGNKLTNLGKLYEQPGKAVSDYQILFGEGVSLINMGLLGLFFTIYVIIIKGALNGPTLAGIFTIVGFGAFGKHLRNTIPVALGTIIASIINIWPINSPGMLLATLFSTTLAPISGVYGPFYGILAGFFHASLVMNIGYLHGGINLYNNGFSGGLVAILLLPIIDIFRKEV